MRLLVIDASSVVLAGTHVNHETEEQLAKMRLPL